jgi:hypothetical protein
METPNSPPMPSDEALIPTAKLGRPPIPGTEGTDEVGAGAGTGSGAVERGTVVDAVAESSPAGTVAANKFGDEIRERISKRTLNEVMLLKRVLLTSLDQVSRNCRMLLDMKAIMGSTIERVK